MTYDYPSYYGQFHCIGGSCPDSCCIGWEVDIDPETWDYYQSLEGSFGDRLRRHMKDDGEDHYFPMCEGGRCPFLNKMNLCDIITKLGEESLSQVCTEYPRYFLEEGDFEQIDMSLSCMELGRIFFEGTNPIEYIREETPDEPGYVESCEATQEGTDGNVCDEQSGPQGADGNVCDVPGDSSRLADNSLLRHILDIRDDCIGIMEDRDLPLAKRFREVIRLYGPEKWRGKDLLTVTDLSSLITLMEKLEILDDRWTDELQEVRKLEQKGSGLLSLKGKLEIASDGRFEIWFEKLGCYFLFRYVTDAYFTTRQDVSSSQPGSAASAESADRLPQPARRHPLTDADAADAAVSSAVSASVRFCARSIYFLYAMCAARYLTSGKLDVSGMIDLAHLYSRQVEHSDENVDFLKTED